METEQKKPEKLVFPGEAARNQRHRTPEIRRTHWEGEMKKK